MPGVLYPHVIMAINRINVMNNTKSDTNCQNG